MMGLGALMTILALTGCRDDDDTDQRPGSDGPAGAWTVTAVTADANDDEAPMLYWRPSYESITESIAGRTGDGPILVSVEGGSAADTDDRWLTVASDTLAADSIVALKTTLNDTGQRRTVTLRFTDAADPAVSGTLRVTQGSQSDTDSNGEDPRSLLYVGYGYDIFKALESPMSVRCKASILNHDLLRQHSGKNRYELIHDSRTTRIQTRYVMSKSIHAFGRDLTEEQTGDSENEFEGCTENCKTVAGNIVEDKGKLNYHNYGHGSLEKAVYARVIDRAALLDLQSQGANIFSDAFNERLTPIRRATGEERRKLIEQLLNDFGTHVVMQADLGGRIDYTFAMSKSVSFNTEEEMREEIDYTLGRIADTDRKAKNKKPSSSKSASGAIVVTGGSNAVRSVLNGEIGALSSSGQINPTHITDWLSTINYSANPESDPNLDVIHFELIPLWDLVDESLRLDIMGMTLRMASRSDCKLPADFLGTDIYEFKTKEEKDFFQFQGITDQTSLCRLLYFEDKPVLEICQEYVPKIRTDQRVTIVYPIHSFQIRMNQGLFLGDGIHQPAYVAFSNGDCYVDVVDSLPPGRIIEKFWYVNGKLMLHNPTTEDNLTGKQRAVRDEYFYYIYDDKLFTYPIVKVGSCFWTRRDMDTKMGFTSNPDSKKNRSDERLEENTLYARFYYDIGYYQNLDNSWLWGYSPNNFLEGKPNQKWYMPEASDIRNLYAFLGFNPKALFKGQQSCFDAQFNGYYGVHDIINNASFGGNNTLHYRGEYCFLSSRNSEDREGVIMVLDPQYHLKVMEARGNWSDDYYPVRPMRGWMYIYPRLSEILYNIQDF